MEWVMAMIANPSWLQVVIGGILGILTLVGSWFGFGKMKKKRQEKDDALENLIREVSNTNKLLVKSLESNGDLLRELNSNFMLVNEPILVETKNEALIIKDAIFQKFGKVWTDKMKSILIENHIDKEERTLCKIESATTLLLKSTYDKINIIHGLDNYVRPVDEVLDMLSKYKVYDEVLELMKKAKADKDYDFKYELFSLFEVTYSKTSL